MDPNIQKSILQMARGAILERADYEMSRLLANILDPNTSATAKSTLAATNPVVTSLYVADEDSVVEMVPQIPGQFGFDGMEQEAPPSLKIIKFA